MPHSDRAERMKSVVAQNLNGLHGLGLLAALHFLQATFAPHVHFLLREDSVIVRFGCCRLRGAVAHAINPARFD
jgi:hypothetical protein